MLFSLRELRGIEARRVEDEAAQQQARAVAAAEACRLADERRRADEAARRAAEEAIERHARETLALRLREEELRVREAEARARADEEARLASEQLTRELEAQRAAALAKRPVWLGAAAGALALVLGVATFVAIDSHRAQSESEKSLATIDGQLVAAQRERDAALARAQQAKLELGQLADELAALGTELDQLDRQIKTANSAAERQVLAERASAARAERARLERDAAARREGFHGKCPPDKPLC